MQSIGEEYIERRVEGQDSIPISKQWHSLIHCEERVASGTMSQSKIYTVQKISSM